MQNRANVICEQPLAIEAKSYPSNDFMLTMSPQNLFEQKME